MFSDKKYNILHAVLYKHKKTSSFLQNLQHETESSKEHKIMMLNSLTLSIVDCKEEN
jgi:uncharacterized membrane protein YbaN (DUF454 family)